MYIAPRSLKNQGTLGSESLRGKMGSLEIIS